MFQPVVRALYRSAQYPVRGAYRSVLLPIIIRRTLRNTRSQVPIDSGQARGGVDEIAVAAELEAKMFGIGAAIHKPTSSVVIRDDDLPVQAKSSKMLKATNTKRLPQPQEHTRQSKKRVPESSPINKYSELGLEYTKLSLNDPLLNKLMLSAKSRKHRDTNNQIVLEGRRLILEALECGCQLRYLLFTHKEQLVPLKDKLRRLKVAKLIKVPQQDLRVWSTLTTCPGVIAIFDRPKDESTFAPKAPILPITVICDNIREPNNLGSIIRSCAAIPCAEVIILKGCCDPWESKTLRGGCGGQFRVKIRYGLTWADMDNQLPDDYRLFVAESKVPTAGESERQDVQAYSDMRISDRHNVLVIGGETHGISEEAYRFLAASGEKGTCLHIPLAPGVESLNSASAVTLLLFEMRKHLQNKEDTENI